MAWVILSLAAFVAFAICASAAAGSKVCADGPDPLLYIQTEDLDSDLLNDSFWMEAQYAPAPPEQAWLNVTVFAPNGSVAASNISSHLTDDLNYTYERYAFALLNTTDINGTYRANVTQDYTNGSCTWFDYYFDLYPPGVYQPAMTGTNLSQSSDENTTVRFALTLTNTGNNPDSFSFYTVGNQSWTIVLAPQNPSLGPGDNVTINVSVQIPHNEPPLTVDAINITVSSGRVPSRRAFIDLRAAVDAQVFGLNFTADNATQEGITGTLLTFGLNLTNLGNNRDTVAMDIPTARSGWQITGPIGIFAPFAGEKVPFELQVRLPYSYTSTFRWNFTVNATAGDGVTKQSIDIHVRLLLPDFVVGPAGMVVNDTTPEAGANVTVEITVLNIGAPIEVTFVVTLWDGVSNLTALTDMMASGSTTASFAWTALLGSTTLEANVDFPSSVPEENESNNRGVFSVTGHAPLPLNLPPTAAAGSATAAGHPGEPIAFSAAGSTDGDGSVVAYFFSFGDGTDSGWLAQSSTAHTYNAVGNYTVTIRVRDNLGSESAPATETVTISNASPSNGGGGGGGGASGGGDTRLWVLVAALGVGGVAALIVLRRRAPKAPPGPPPEHP